MNTPLSFNSKYNSLESMLKDKSYCKWLIQQTWFQKRDEYHIVKLMFEKHNPIRIVKRGLKFVPHNQRCYPFGKFQGFVPYSYGLFLHIYDNDDLNKEYHQSLTERVEPCEVRCFNSNGRNYQEKKFIYAQDRYIEWLSNLNDKSENLKRFLTNLNKKHEPTDTDYEQIHKNHFKNQVFEELIMLAMHPDRIQRHLSFYEDESEGLEHL